LILVISSTSRFYLLIIQLFVPFLFFIHTFLNTCNTRGNRVIYSFLILPKLRKNTKKKNLIVFFSFLNHKYKDELYYFVQIFTDFSIDQAFVTRKMNFLCFLN